MAEFDGWPDEASEALARVLDQHRIDRDDDGATRPVIALDFDNTCILGDVGETIHYVLCDRFSYALDDEDFWGVIAPEDGRERLRNSWRELRRQGVTDASQGEDAQAFANDLIAVYARRAARLGKEAAYQWAPRMHAGLSRTWLHRAALAHFEAEGSAPLRTEERIAPDGVRLVMQRGLRVRPAFRELIALFSENGFAVWVVSATNSWTVQAVAPHLGVSSRRIIGNACRVEGDRITDVREGPTTWRRGKVEAIQQAVGRPPVLAVGDTWTDLEMLESATDLAILVDRGDPELASIADERGWLRVPAGFFDLESPRLS